MGKLDYLMEDEEEALRLDIKTDLERVKKQALWAGIKPGMRVADVGCGSGRVSSILYKLVEPNGEVVGIDFSEERISYAITHYGRKGIKFIRKNILSPLEDIGFFDFVWVRYVLQYYREESFNIVENISKILQENGIICLIDQDYNCLTHYQIPYRLEKTIFDIIKNLEKDMNFDPYVGRKLYSYLYDLGYTDIRIDFFINAVYGQLKERDAFNWLKKIEVISQKINYDYPEYNGNFEHFFEEIKKFLTDPRRFTYTPVILCRGVKASL